MTNILRKVYMDESGNTGSNILNESQKYFVLSSISLTDQELSTLENDINYGEELHFVKMKNSIRGRQAIKQILQHPLVNANNVTFQYIDKTFCIYAQITDIIIESVFHYCFEEDLYKNKMNIKMANCLYTFAEKYSDQMLTDQFKKSFELMIRHQTHEAISTFYDTVKKIKVNAIKEFADILSIIELSQDITDCILMEDNIYRLDTTLTCFITLISHWYKSTGQKIDIITDNSKQLKASEKVIEKLIKIKNTKVVGYDTRKITYPLPVNSITMVDSKTSFGVQIADIIASTVTFISNETDKFKVFQDEIKLLPFKRIPCYPLVPSSAEELLTEVDNSNDIDPIDFLMKHI